MQCETISLIKFQPSHSAVDFFGNLGAFHWENPNPDSRFYFKAANSLLKQKRPTSCKIKNQEKNLLEAKLRKADVVPCNLQTTLGQNTLSDLYVRMRSSDHIMKAYRPNSAISNWFSGAKTKRRIL